MLATAFVVAGLVLVFAHSVKWGIPLLAVGLVDLIVVAIWSGRWRHA